MQSIHQTLGSDAHAGPDLDAQIPAWAYVLFDHDGLLDTIPTRNIVEGEVKIAAQCTVKWRGKKMVVEIVSLGHTAEDGAFVNFDEKWLDSARFVALADEMSRRSKQMYRTGGFLDVPYGTASQSGDLKMTKNKKAKAPVHGSHLPPTKRTKKQMNDNHPDTETSEDTEVQETSSVTTEINNISESNGRKLTVLLEGGEETNMSTTERRMPHYTEHLSTDESDIVQNIVDSFEKGKSTRACQTNDIIILDDVEAVREMLVSDVSGVESTVEKDTTTSTMLQRILKKLQSIENCVNELNAKVANIEHNPMDISDLIVKNSVIQSTPIMNILNNASDMLSTPATLFSTIGQPPNAEPCNTEPHKTDTALTYDYKPDRSDTTPYTEPDTYDTVTSDNDTADMYNTDTDDTINTEEKGNLIYSSMEELTAAHPHIYPVSVQRVDEAYGANQFVEVASR